MSVNVTIDTKQHDGRPRLESIIPQSPANVPRSLSTRNRLASINIEPSIPKVSSTLSTHGEEPEKAQKIIQLVDMIEKPIENPFASRYREYPNLIEIYMPEVSFR